MSAVPALISDIRLALRALRHGGSIAGLAVGTIALVICGVTLMASVVVGVLVDDGPYRQPSRVVGLQFKAPTMQYASIYFPYDDYASLQGAAAGPDGVFDALLPLGVAYVMMTGRGEPAHLNAGVMPGETFRLLGVGALLGRTLTPDDDRPGAPAVVVIGEEVWRQAFGGDPGVVGQTVRIDDRAHEIVGVMPARFTWGVLNAWLPMRMDLYGAVTSRFVQVTGWLRDGVSERQALSRLDAAFGGLVSSGAGSYPPGASLTFAHSALPAVRNDVRQGLVLLSVALTLLAVVGCVDVAALLLARTTGRLGELGIRAALGASRWRIARAQTAEAAVIAAVGAAAGVALAYLLLPVLLAAMPPGVLPLGGVVALDWRVLLCTVVATAVVSLVCGILPALLVTRTDVEASVRQTSRGSTAPVASRRLWRLLVGVEVAMATTLLVLTAVFARGLLALQAEPLHYSPERVVALGVTVSDHRYATLARENVFLRDAVERVRALPGIEAVTIAYPGGPRNVSVSDFAMTGRRPAGDERVGVRMVGADYFHVFRIATVRGRAPSADDERAGRRVAVVNGAFVRRYGANTDVIGRQVRVAAVRHETAQDVPGYEIIGVVDDVVNSAATNRAEPEIALLAGRDALSRNWYLVARATRDAASVVKPIQRAVWAIDPDQAFRSIMTEEERLWISRFGWPTFRTVLLGVFGALALALVGAGAYGIVSYTTTRESRDIGIRLAIGSGKRAIVRHVLGRNVTPVFAGMGVGAGVAAAGGTAVRALVGGVSPWDPAAYLAASGILLLVTATACWIPARRASRLDPTVVLRGD